MKKHLLTLALAQISFSSYVNANQVHSHDIDKAILSDKNQSKNERAQVQQLLQAQSLMLQYFNPVDKAKYAKYSKAKFNERRNHQKSSEQGNDGSDVHQLVDGNLSEKNEILTPVPLPAAAWLFGAALLGFVAMARRR